MKNVSDQVAENRGINEVAVAVMMKYFPNECEETASSIFDFARSNNVEALRELIRSTEHCTPEEHEMMISQSRDYAFIDAAALGYIDIVNYLIEMTPDEDRRRAMIHVNNNAAFRWSAVMGHVDIVKLLIEMTPDEQKQAMIHADNDLAFRWSAENGHIDILKLLIEMTPDDEQKQAMIHANNDDALIGAATNGHIDIINYLIEMTPDDEQRQAMIHANNDDALTGAAENGHIDIANLIIEMTPDEQKQTLINKITNPTPDLNRLLTITAPELGAQDDETDKTKKLRELHTDLIERFGGRDDAVKKANSVIATLLSRDNLERVGQHFGDVSSICRSNSLSSGSVVLPTEVFREVTDFNFPIDFPILSKSDKETALARLAHLLNRPAAERIRNHSAQNTGTLNIQTR
jgi:ankyrin repeat protein